MAEYDIARLLQNAEFEETLPEESNADDINTNSAFCSSLAISYSAMFIYQIDK
jgi:hypothetical protein